MAPWLAGDGIRAQCDRCGELETWEQALKRGLSELVRLEGGDDDGRAR